MKAKLICGDCIHCNACSSMCRNNLYETSATHCVNYEKMLTDIELIHTLESVAENVKGVRLGTIGVVK